MSEQPKRRGRPPLPDSERKSPAKNLTFRARDGLRQKLSKAAVQSERSVSEEIERRLERSFEMSSGDIVSLVEDALQKALERAGIVPAAIEP